MMYRKHLFPPRKLGYEVRVIATDDFFRREDSIKAHFRTAPEVEAFLATFNDYDAANKFVKDAGLEGVFERCDITEYAEDGTYEVTTLECLGGLGPVKTGVV